MKKISMLILIFFVKSASAQMVDGSIAPDFTFFDINGQQQHLYSYLNSNKFVLLDISATWCAPCWMMHDSFHLLNHVYNAFDTPGDQTGKVLLLEADPATGLSDLQGTGPMTQGDWITGTGYPIMNPDSIPLAGETSLASFGASYPVFGMPQLLLICPNKKVWRDTLNNEDKVTPWPPPLSTIQWLANTKCNLPSALDEWDATNPLSVYMNTKSNEVNLLFSLLHQADIRVKLLNSFGQVVKPVSMLNLPAGDHSINYSTSDLANGMYLLQLSTSEHRSVTKKIMIVR